MLNKLGSYHRVPLAYLSKLILHLRLCHVSQPVCPFTTFMLSSDGSFCPACEILLITGSLTLYTSEVKATTQASGSTKRVYQRIRTFAPATIATSAPDAEFHCETTSGQMCWLCC